MKFIVYFGNEKAEFNMAGGSEAMRRAEDNTVVKEISANISDDLDSLEVILGKKITKVEIVDGGATVFESSEYTEVQTISRAFNNMSAGCFVSLRKADNTN